MSAPSRVNSDDNISCSRPNISTSTPITNKRASPDSPDDLPATEKQEKRQIRIKTTVTTMPHFKHIFDVRISLLIIALQTV
jgi:hypothetical protein